MGVMMEYRQAFTVVWNKKEESIKRQWRLKLLLAGMKQLLRIRIGRRCSPGNIFGVI
jgi:hypothetical protein